MQALLLDLPEELLSLIVSFLDIFDRRHPKLVSRQFQSLIDRYTLPYSARSLKQKNPNVADGLHTIYFLGRHACPFEVYIEDLDSPDPKEYLPLPLVRRNFSSFRTGGSAHGRSLVTFFRMLRIDVLTLTVKTDDFRHTVNVGGPITQVWHNGSKREQWTSVPFGTAREACGWHSHTAFAMIDLSGTPFGVVSDFRPRGWQASGRCIVHGEGEDSFLNMFDRMSDENSVRPVEPLPTRHWPSRPNQRITLYGGGFAGGIYPEDDTCEDNGEGKNGGWALRLSFCGLDPRSDARLEQLRPPVPM